MTTYYKAVRPDGTDFHTGTVQWTPPEGREGEWIVRHPSATEVGGDASEYLSVSTAPTACTGMAWPCRLLAVSAVGDVTKPPGRLPYKRAGVAFRVTGELPAHMALGPQGEHVAALIERARHLTPDEARAISLVQAARWTAVEDSVRITTRRVARSAARSTALHAAWNAAWNTAGDAAGALVVRDLISADQYDALTRTWASVIGKVHPDD